MNSNEMHTNKNSQAEKQMDKMLREIEHAGRDSRRQQHLSNLIDQLASKEASAALKQRKKRWIATISAAACITLFVTTIVKLTETIPSAPNTGTIVAKNENDTIIRNERINITDELEKRDSVIVVPQHIIRKNEPPLIAENGNSLIETEIEESEITEIEDTIIEDIHPDALLSEDIKEDNSSLLDSIVAPIVSFGNSDNIAVKQEKEQERKRRGLLRLRRTEPSIMDGTVLALRIL